MIGSVASALAEAWESGQPVAPHKADLALACLEAAEQVAGDVLERLALPPCGIRVSETGLVGAMLPGRIMATGQTLPLSVLPHGHAAPALLAVLGEAITPDGTALPAFERLHPALDLSASRWRDGPANLFEAAADLAGLGQLVIGKGKRTGFPSSCALAPQRALRVDCAALLETAVNIAREAGGLPLGAVLVLVFDRSGQALGVPGPITARWTGLGGATAELR
jgi:2-keto-4-pentenoate hydratase